jgi:indolepyruvate ferredoxin oxidoreductase beta subunit
LVNQQAIAPITVSAGSAHYPSMDTLRSELARAAQRVFWAPAMDIARALGNDKVTNVVLLGALSALLATPERVWLKAIESRVPARFLQLNQLAFQRGREALAFKDGTVGVETALCDG